MAPSEQAGHPKMLLKSPSKPSLAGLSRAKMSKAQLPKGEDFKRNPDVQEVQPARIGSRKGSSVDGSEKNGSCGAGSAVIGRTKSRLHLNNEVAKGVEIQDGDQELPSSGRVRARIQVMELGAGQEANNGLSRAKSRVQLPGAGKVHQVPGAKVQHLPSTAHQVKKDLIKGISKEKSVVGLNKAKNRSQLVIKKEPKKTLVKTRSRAVLKDKNDPVSVITDDALDVRNNKKKGDKEVEQHVVKTPEEEERLSATVTAVVADHCYTSPAASSRLSATSTTSSVPSTSNHHKSTTGGGNHCLANQTPKQSTRRVNSRIAFSDVSVFFFDRNIADCSVPRQGAHTMGMEGKHSHFERRQLGVDEEDEDAVSPHVRRKLFSIQAAADPEEEAEVAIQMLEMAGESDAGMTPVGRLWSQQRPLLSPTAPKTERSMSTSEKLERLSTEDPEQPRVVFSDYRTSRLAAGSEDSDSDDGGGGGGGGQTQRAADATSSKATPAAAVSSSYKRSLSRAYSSDFIATRERKASASNCPPCKASRNVGLEETPALSNKATEEISVNILEETPTTSQPSQRLLMMKTRSSSRINGGKSILSSFQNPPDEKPKPMLTPKSLKSSRSMTRAFTTANLKVQSNVEKESESETPSEPLPKPSRKLASSITTSCLKSFQEFHISPESKIVTEVDEENDLPVPRPKFARSNSKKFQRPAEVPLERGSSISKKKPAKKGACGTRGLTPLGERARVSLLRSHGVQNLQGRAEQEELDVLRESREKCGCSCVGPCQPLTCQCALAGIECQVEREGFPCSCGPSCENPEGRREFDETEVSLHYINTMMSMRGVMDVQTSSQESLVSAVDIGTF